MSCGTKSGTTEKELKFIDNDIAVIFGSSTLASVSFCKFIESVDEYQLSEVTIPASGSKTIVFNSDSESWSNVILKATYGSDVDLIYQKLYYKINSYLVDPISKVLSPDFSLIDSNFSAYLPVSTLTLNVAPVSGDIVKISNISLIAGTDFAINASTTISATNIMNAINSNSTLLNYVSSTSSTNTVVVSGLKPYKSYATIGTIYIPITTSSNVFSSTKLSSNILIDDSVQSFHQIGIINQTKNEQVNLFVFYNFYTQPVTLQILKTK